MRYHNTLCTTQYSRVKSSNGGLYTLILASPTAMMPVVVVFFRAPSHESLVIMASPMFAILFAMGSRWPYDTFLGEFVRQTEITG
jgi:hypothetical protein